MNVARAQARSSTPHAHTGTTQARTNNAQAHANNSLARANNAQARASKSKAQTHATNNTAASTTKKTVSPTTTAATNARSSLSGSVAPATYTYGTGTNARRYRAYGYGSGYRNRYYGARYGYGRSQGNNLAIISRLRSVHASLATVNHNYQGHRVRAMQSIAMAIRQLSHRSMIYSGTGFASGVNNGAGVGMGMGRGIRRSALGGAGALGGQVMNQAQSDARMGQALRNLQGIGMQLAHQGTYTMGHGRALGHIQLASRELNVALSIR